MDCGDNNFMDTDALLPPPTRKSAGLDTQPLSSKARNRESASGRKKRSKSKPKRNVKDKTSGDDNDRLLAEEDVCTVHMESVTKVKSWEQEGVTPMDEDLASCPTLYDRIVKEAMPTCGHHLEGTQKQSLSTVDDLRDVAALEERLKEEKTKHTHLQKEMLTSLHRSKGEYHEAVVKAKGDKRRQHKKTKHSHLQKEMRGVLKSLRRSNGEYREALVKTKQDKQREEILDVERQIAEVGILLLQSSSSS